MRIALFLVLALLSIALFRMGAADTETRMETYATEHLHSCLDKGNFVRTDTKQCRKVRDALLVTLNK